MKRLLLVISLLLLVGCTTEKAMNMEEIATNEVVLEIQKDEIVTEVPFEFAEPYEKKVSENITLRVDPKVEATYLIFQMISDETGFIQYGDMSYILKQLDYFSEYKDHPVMALTLKMYNEGFSYDAIPSVLHQYNNNFELRDGVVANEEVIGRAGGSEQVKEFLEALYDFRRVSQYDDYFREQTSYYDDALSRAYKYIINSNMEQVYLDYYGEFLGEVVVVVTPDCYHGYGVTVTYEDRKVLMPTLAVPRGEENYIAFLLHEISHPYVNSQSDLRLEMVEEIAQLYEPIKEEMGKQTYVEWIISLNEHIVRANVIQMMENIYGELYRDKLTYNEKQKDFIYIDNVLDSLDYYKVSREAYPIFNMYFDTILENLKTELKE